MNSKIIGFFTNSCSIELNTIAKEYLKVVIENIYNLTKKKASRSRTMCTKLSKWKTNKGFIVLLPYFMLWYEWKMALNICHYYFSFTFKTSVDIIQHCWIDVTVKRTITSRNFISKSNKINDHVVIKAIEFRNRSKNKRRQRTCVLSAEITWFIIINFR